MNITVTKILRELESKHGWYIGENNREKELIKDVRTIINNYLIIHKNISIKK
jgi:hypothetical protein